MSTQLMTPTRLCYIGHHTTETSRLHSCCSNVVHTSMRGTKRDIHHCTKYWSDWLMAPRVISSIRYCSYLSMVRTLMHWMTPSRLRFMWHQHMAAPKLHGYCSSVAQVSISRTTRDRPPPRLRRRRVTRRSNGCCRSICRVSRRCDIYSSTGLL